MGTGHGEDTRKETASGVLIFEIDDEINVGEGEVRQEGRVAAACARTTNALVAWGCGGASTVFVGMECGAWGGSRIWREREAHEVESVAGKGALDATVNGCSAVQRRGHVDLNKPGLQGTVQHYIIPTESERVSVSERVEPASQPGKHG